LSLHKQFSSTTVGACDASGLSLRDRFACVYIWNGACWLLLLRDGVRFSLCRIETIAASYVQTSANSKLRLFNLSPDTKQAGCALKFTLRSILDLLSASKWTSLSRMSCSANGTKEIASGVAFGLGSDWATVATASAVGAQVIRIRCCGLRLVGRVLCLERLLVVADLLRH
jgi:hypothetical protein